TVLLSRAKQAAAIFPCGLPMDPTIPAPRVFDDDANGLRKDYGKFIEPFQKSSGCWWSTSLLSLPFIIRTLLIGEWRCSSPERQGLTLRCWLTPATTIKLKTSNRLWPGCSRTRCWGAFISMIGV